MSNVIELRNGSVKRIIFYEVADAQDIAIWGGESASEALKWYRNSPNGSRIYIQEWLTDEEDVSQLSSSIEITPIVLSTIANCMDRWV
jgi:hypothetical protein